MAGMLNTVWLIQVDKLVSSLSATVVGIAVSFIGIKSLPTAETPFAPGMNAVVIILFCIVPMIAWVITIIAMKGYILTGDEMKKIQDVNQKRKKAIAEGMSIEKAMKEFT